MSIAQAAETKLAYADFLAHLTDEYEDVRWGSAYSTGTRVFAKVRGKGWKAFLISDLTAPIKVSLVNKLGLATINEPQIEFANSGSVTLSVVDIPASNKVRVVYGPSVQAPHATFHAPGSPTTWIGMPAAKTELFGASLQNAVVVTMTALPTNAFIFSANIPFPSNTPGAYLTIDYSLDSGTTWTEMDSTARFDANGTLFGYKQGTVPLGARVVGVWLRIAGSGGGGVGDNPTFGTISAQFF